MMTIMEVFFKSLKKKQSKRRGASPATTTMAIVDIVSDNAKPHSGELSAVDRATMSLYHSPQTSPRQPAASSPLVHGGTGRVSSLSTSPRGSYLHSPTGLDTLSPLVPPSSRPRRMARSRWNDSFEEFVSRQDIYSAEPLVAPPRRRGCSVDDDFCDNWQPRTNKLMSDRHLFAILSISAFFCFFTLSPFFACLRFWHFCCCLLPRWIVANYDLSKLIVKYATIYTHTQYVFVQEWSIHLWGCVHHACLAYWVMLPWYNNDVIIWAVQVLLMLESLFFSSCRLCYDKQIKGGRK